MEKMNVGDIEISISGGESYFVNYGKSVFVGDALLVFQFDEDVLSLINDTGELHDKVNAMIIFNLPCENSKAKYKEDLKNLITYIIYHNENINIVYDYFWICNPIADLHNLAIEAVQETQKKITKNDYELFPKVDATCFQKDLSNFNLTFSPTDHLFYFAKVTGPSTEITETVLPLTTDITDGWKYREDYATNDDSSSSSGSTATKVLVSYTRLDLYESYSINLEGMYFQSMGVATTSINAGDVSISLTRRLHPDIYKQVQD